MKELTLAKRFASGERLTAVTVVRRDGGLAPADLAAIGKVRASLAAAPPVTGSRAVLARVSRDRGAEPTAPYPSSSSNRPL